MVEGGPVDGMRMKVLLEVWIVEAEGSLEGRYCAVNQGGEEERGM
jgi:hypothetical protein